MHPSATKTENINNSIGGQGQEVEAILETHDKPTSFERNGNETSLPFTEEETDGNGKAVLDPIDEDFSEQPSKKGGKDKEKEGQLKWWHKPLVTPASLLALLALNLLCLAAYFGVSTANARNATVTIASSENIAAAAANPGGTITLNKDGSISISGDVKLPTDIEVQGIALEAGAVLHPDGHSISGPGSNVDAGIKVNEYGEMTISRNVKLTANIVVPDELGHNRVAITLLDGVGLDCDDHSITGGGFFLADGIKVDGSDGTQIKNCDVSGFRVGASFFGVKDVFIENSSFHSNKQNGIYAVNGGTFEMKGVTAEDNGEAGIYLDDWDEVKLDNVVTSGNDDDGIYGEIGGTLEMNDVTAEDNEGRGISLEGWDNVILNNIVASGSNDGGVYAHSGGTFEMKGVTAEDNGEAGIYLQNWNNVKLDNVVTKGNSYFGNNFGIYASNGGTFEMKGVTAEDNREYEIYLEDWDDVKLDNVVARGNYNFGVYAFNGGTFEMSGVSAEDNEGYGIYLDDWDNVKLDNVVARGNGDKGVYAVDGGTFEMKVVTAEGNWGDGISLDGWDEVKLDTVEANGNADDGIQIHQGGEAILEDINAEQNSGDGVVYSGNGLTLKGKNSLSGNLGNGLNIEGVTGTKTVSVDAKAKVIANDNVNVGIKVDSDAAFELAKKASLEACTNSYDFLISSGVTANFMGKKYICETVQGNNGPDCKPCK